MKKISKEELNRIQEMEAKQFEEMYAKQREEWSDNLGGKNQEESKIVEPTGSLILAPNENLI